MGSLFVSFLAAIPLAAQDTNTLEIIRQLQKRIEELERKVESLEGNKTRPGDQNRPKAAEGPDQKLSKPAQRSESETASGTAKEKALPKISIGADGFSFGSAKDDFLVQLKGVLQVDSRTFFNDAGIVGNDSFLLRRARPVLQGKVYRDFDFLFVPDFGSTGSPQIFDAYVNYRYAPELQFQAGKFKVPVGLEQLQADRDILFNERALPTDLVPNRDLGFELHGDLFGGRASYAAGIFSGAGDAQYSRNADFEDDKAFAGRLFFEPFKKSSVASLNGLGVGLSGSYEGFQSANAAALPGTTGGTLPGYTTVGQQQFFAYNPAPTAGQTPVILASGEHWRMSPQGYYFFGPLGVLGEYVISDQGVKRSVVAPRSVQLDHRAWQVTASYVLTGERATFTGVVPRKPFDPRAGQWGAWQLVARYAELNIDSAAFPDFADPASSARGAREWSAGVSWWLNRNLRINASFSHTTFEGGGSGTTAPGIVTRKPEDVLFTRVQLAF